MLSYAIAGIAFLVTVFLVTKGVRDARALSLTEERLRLTGWPKELDGLRVLHISDLHLYPGSTLGDRVFALAEAASPDVVVISGDMLLPGRMGRREAVEFLEKIARALPTFLAPGNEDRLRDGSIPLDEWNPTGARVLVNQAERLSRNGCRYWIAGVDDPHEERDDMAEAFSGIPAGDPVILVAHSPAISKRSGAARAAVIFSGHTHGGQICLPNGKALYIRTRLPRKFAAGVHMLDNKAVMVISRGAGTTRLPIRLWCPPELTVWTLNR